MAASIVQSISTDNTSGDNCTLSLSGVASGNALLVVISSVGSGGSDATFTGATFVRQVTQSQGNFQLQQWLVLGVSSGGYTIVGTVSGSNVTSMVLMEVTGLKATGQPDQTSVNNTGGGVPQFGPQQPGSVTPSAASELAITACALYVPAGTGNLSVDSGYTIQENVRDGYLAVAYKSVSAATNPAWSVAGGQYVYADIAVYANASAPAGSTYSYSQQITINASLCGSSNSTNFPFLFGGAAGPYASLATLINGGNILHTLSFNGQTVPADLIFTSDSAGTSLLNWEVASYNATTGDIEVWIQIPTLSSMTNTVIYMFAGNALVTTYQGGSVGAVWDSNFVSVYHLANGSSLSLVDSTSNARTLTNNNSVTAASGRIDGAADFVGSSSQSLSNGSYPTSSVAAVTLESWFNVSGLTGNQEIIGWGHSDQCDLFLGGSTLTAAFHGAGGGYAEPSKTISSGVWVHVVATYDGTTARLYVNGSQVSTSTGTSGNITSLTDEFALGALPGGGPRYLTGYIDEGRVSITNRSADWITAEYNNQSSPSTFYTLANIPSGSTSTNQLMLMGCGM